MNLDEDVFPALNSSSRCCCYENISYNSTRDLCWHYCQVGTWRTRTTRSVIFSRFWVFLYYPISATCRKVSCSNGTEGPMSPKTRIFQRFHRLDNTDSCITKVHFYYTRARAQAGPSGQLFPVSLMELRTRNESCFDLRDASLYNYRWWINQVMCLKCA